MKVKVSNVLTIAATLVYGHREKTYGHPRDNFKTIVDMWNAYLTRRGIVTDALIVERDVAMMFVLVKVAREGVAATRDNLVDIAGYAATAERLDE